MDSRTDETVKVAGAVDQGVVVSVDLDDLREFVQYLEAGLDLKAAERCGLCGCGAGLS